ncbi:immunodominant staphylococcal antigen IsaB family protein [Staphylococcus warneri]|uniref:immunodominant staphylococcal antigen IsaB family protein n=1 Tax=Staphylococcus warneri TaxID=1292 RepID=UPI0018EAA6C0|nr:hypothetical protein [Staphylococcus warneri]
MNTLSKSLLTGTLAVGVALGVGVEDLSHHEAHAATQPYYNYHGYTSSQSDFILDNNFINAIKNDNLTINGYKITENSKGNDNDTIEKFDQQFYLPSKGKADGVWFQLKPGVVSKAELVKTYGKPLNKPSGTAHGNEYLYQFNEKQLRFLENNGYITEVGIHNGKS